MIRDNSYHTTLKLRATCALVLALAVSTFPAAFSRPVKAQTPAKTSAQTPVMTSSATESKGGQKEGIKVHGHWTIDVLNPDGKLVTHRDFENALTNSGGVLISAFLTGVITPGPWLVTLVGDACNPAKVSSFGTNCVIGVPGSTLADFLTLSVIFNDSPNITFRGTATAATVGTITAVRTMSERTCPNTTSPDQCAHNPVNGGSGFLDFTAATLVNSVGQPTPISLVGGQIIQVTVKISFS